MEFAGGAGGDDDDLMAAFGEADGEVAGEGGDAVDLGVVVVGGNDDFHVRIIITLIKWIAGISPAMTGEG